LFKNFVLVLLFKRDFLKKNTKMTSLFRKSLAVVSLCLLMSGARVLAQVAEEVTAENFGDPVIYANSSATVYGVVTINDQPAEAGDVVGFFVGTELRFKGTVVINAGAAYITGLANMAGGDETITFKVYDDSAKMVYPVPSISLTVAPESTTGPSPLFEVKAAGTLPADTTAPVIALTGSASVSLQVGGTYVDAGASATDSRKSLQLEEKPKLILSARLPVRLCLLAMCQRP
jgi:hypothetical protein